MSFLICCTFLIQEEGLSILITTTSLPVITLTFWCLKIIIISFQGQNIPHWNKLWRRDVFVKGHATASAVNNTTFSTITHGTYLQRRIYVWIPVIRHGWPTSVAQSNGHCLVPQKEQEMGQFFIFHEAIWCCLASAVSLWLLPLADSKHQASTPGPKHQALKAKHQTPTTILQTPRPTHQAPNTRS